MSIRELHGIAAKSAGGATGRYLQTIHIIDGEEPATVVIAMSEAAPATITADEARFLADLLNEAADRVEPRPDVAAAETEVAMDALDALVEEAKPFPPRREEPEFVVTGREEWPKAAPLEPLPSLIAVRNPKPQSPWSPERNAMMRVEVPLGRLTREELFMALNALGDAPPIPFVGRLGSQAHSLGLTWGPPLQPAPAAPEAAQEPVPEPIPEPLDVPNGAGPGVSAVPADASHIPMVPFERRREPEVLAMDFEQVKVLASRWGVDFGSWDDLPPVNAKADRLGHPRIERRYVLPRKLHNLDAD